LIIITTVRTGWSYLTISARSHVPTAHGCSVYAHTVAAKGVLATGEAVSCRFEIGRIWVLSSSD
jgi:hypothetical protein